MESKTPRTTGRGSVHADTTDDFELTAGLSSVTENRWDPDNIIEVLASSESRNILSAASVRPVSAEELEQVCDVSLPTVYRRINVLLEYDLLSEVQAVDPEKGQYRRFRTDLKEVSIVVEDGGFDIEIRLRRDTVDRFSDVIEDLSKGAQDDRDETGQNR